VSKKPVQYSKIKSLISYSFLGYWNMRIKQLFFAHSGIRGRAGCAAD
jgi:hypothetical protein